MFPPTSGLPHVVTVPSLCRAAKAPTVARIISTFGGIPRWGCPRSLDAPQLRTSPFSVRAAKDPLVLIMSTISPAGIVSIRPPHSGSPQQTIFLWLVTAAKAELFDLTICTDESRPCTRSLLPPLSGSPNVVTLPSLHVFQPKQLSQLQLRKEQYQIRRYFPKLWQCHWITWLGRHTLPRRGSPQATCWHFDRPDPGVRRPPGAPHTPSRCHRPEWPQQRAH